jgi:hypothetical protein
MSFWVEEPCSYVGEYVFRKKILPPSSRFKCIVSEIELVKVREDGRSGVKNRDPVTELASASAQKREKLTITWRNFLTRSLITNMLHQILFGH